MQQIRQSIFQRSSRQRGLITRAQLDELAANASRRRRLVAEGSLRPLASSVYAVGGAPLDQRTHVLAACLEVDGLASHASAAALVGLPNWSIPSPPDVIVAGRRRGFRSTLGRVHTTTNLGPDDQVVVDGIPCTSVARTLLCLAGTVPELPEERFRTTVDDAVRLRLATDGWLWWTLERLRCRGRDGVAVLERVLADRANSPTESWLEREYLRVTDAAQIERPVVQARIAAHGAFVARVDFLYERRRVVVEVTGAVGHSTPEQRAADAKRRNALLLQGFVVLEFTYEQVVRNPELVVATVIDALHGLAVA